ncbi:MAG TPA: hypothetical protein VF845_13320 [Terriglobales bacterium]
MQIFVAGAEQGLDVGTDFNTFLHSELWRCLLQPEGLVGWSFPEQWMWASGSCTQELSLSVEGPGTRASVARTAII